MAQKIDVSDYMHWEKIVTPEGQVLYLVPGSPLAYDPYLSRLQGHNIFFRNPKPALDEKKKQEEKGSASNQAIQVGSGIAGGLAGAYATRYLGPSPAPQTQVTANGNVVQTQLDGTVTVNGVPQTPGQPIGGANSPAATSTTTGAPVVTPAGTPAAAPNQGAFISGTSYSGGTGGAYPVGTAANGGTMMSDGSVVPPGANAPASTTANAPSASGTGYSSAGLGAAQVGIGAYQGYQGYQNWQRGDRVGGGLQMAQGANNIYGGAATATGSAAGASTSSDIGLGIAAGLAAYNQYKLWNNKNLTSKQKATRAQQQAGLAVADVYTFGAASLLEGAARRNNFISKYLSKLDALDASMNPTTLLLARFGSSKGSEQMFRDKIRKELIKNNIIDANYQGTLADGTKFDFGKDGKGLAKIDYKDPTTTQVIPFANLIAVGEGFTGKGTAPVARWYTGAALSNANGDYERARQNFQHFANQRGMTQENLLERLKAMKESKAISDSEYAAYTNQANELFRQGGTPPVVVAHQPVAATPTIPTAPQTSNTPINPNDTVRAQMIGTQLADRYNARNKI